MATKRMTSTRQKAAALAYFLAFIACIPLANWMIGNVGTACAPPHGPCLVPVAPWGPDGHPLMAPSGVLMIGLALVLRDMVQRRLGRAVGLAAIVAGAALSGAIAPPQLVFASTMAFLLSELADFAVYTPLQSRGLVLAVLAEQRGRPDRRQHPVPVAGLRQPRIPRRPDRRQALDGGCFAAVHSLDQEAGDRQASRPDLGRHRSPAESLGLHAGHRPFLIARPLPWGKSSMFKSILAVSEGGPDAAMSFKLAARVAGMFDGTVDALHLPVGPAGGMAGGLAMSGEAMPLIMNLDDERLEERAAQSERAYKEIVAPVKGATYTAAKTATLDTLVAMGRCADLLVLGRPGADPENVAPATVEAAIHECARAVMIAPPNAGEGPFGSVIVAWNGSFQAARAVEYSLPFLAKASLITILVAGNTPDDVGAPYLARNLGRHGLKTTIDAIDPGAVSGRARGRALLDYTHGKGADLLVMGAYGRGQVMSFLGFGGATGKVISSCRVPLLMAH